jgi:hypothetical protein
VAAALVSLMLASLVGVVRGGSRAGDEGATSGEDAALVLDGSATTVEAAEGPAVTLAPAEGTLPPTVPEPVTAAPAVVTAAATARATTATTSAARAAATPTTRAAAPAAAAARPTTTVTTKKPTTTAAKKAVATTVRPTTTTAAKAVVKQPTTTVKKPATTTTTAAPKRTWTADEVQAIIRRVWPADSVGYALEVAYRESTYRSNAYNGWCCYGVFQINASAHKRRLTARGLTTADLFDAEVNVAIALEIYEESGWGPWGG